MDTASSPPRIVPIFATPFGVLELPEAELNPVLAELLWARARADGAQDEAPLCYSSADDLLEWADEPVKKLASGILRAIWSFVAAINELSIGQLQSLRLQARAWSTIVPPHGYVTARSYPMTSWCAMYCVAAPETAPDRGDSGALRLYESRLGTTFSDATNSVMRIPFRLGHYTWRPVPGHVGIFPASMTHEVGLIRAPQRLMLVMMRARFVAPGQEGFARW